MLSHLWMGAAAPPELLDLFLCRDIYHCLPRDLDEQDADRITQHLQVMAAEGKARAMIAAHERARDQKDDDDG